MPFGFVTPAAGGGAQTVSVATSNITSAQLKTLLATPVTLVAAPGAGTTLMPLAWFVYYTFNSVPYTLPDGDGAWVTLGDIAQANVSSVFSANQDAGILFAGPEPPDPATPTGATFATSFVNAPILLQSFSVGEMTLGNGTFRITTYYTTITTP